jgi:hypothetical protein
MRLRNFEPKFTNIIVEVVEVKNCTHLDSAQAPCEITVSINCACERSKWAPLEYGVFQGLPL